MTLQIAPITETCYLQMGSDPEFFFQNKSGKIFGSEKFIPPEGFNNNRRSKWDRVVRDGVQGELHHTPTGCRANAESYMGQTILQFKQNLPPGILLNLIDQGIIVTPQEFQTLSPQSKEFGCKPNYNIDFEGPSPMPLTGEQTRERFAGGHWLITLDSNTFYYKDFDPEWYKKIVALLDIMVGIPCVLLDQSSASTRRRQFYGRAGEYRLPKFGLEYRVLSNFWLRDYRLHSLVGGLIRFAFNAWFSDPGYKTKVRWVYEPAEKCITTPPTGDSTIVEPILKAVPRELVREIINTNNKQLAQETFELIWPVLNRETHPQNCPIWEDTEEAFKEFHTAGMAHWFGNDHDTIVNRWAALGDPHRVGWESYFNKTFGLDDDGAADS